MGWPKAVREFANVEPWSAEAPRLYDAELTTPGERVRLRIGFRTVRVANGQGVWGPFVPDKLYTLTLESANSYTGATNIVSGALTLQDNATLQNTSGRSLSSQSTMPESW